MKNEKTIDMANAIRSALGEHGELFAAANLLGAPDLGVDMPKNTVSMANDSRFVQANFSQPLTDYATGWGQANPMLDDNLEHVAPLVVTPRRFEFAAGTNAEYYLSETDDIRSIGADFKRVDPYTSTKVNSKTHNKGLSYRYDKDEAVGIPDFENRIVSRLMTRLKLNDFRRAVALLKASATNVAKTWDTTAGKDPDSDALASIILGNESIGNPGLTRGIYGVTAWQKRVLSLRSQNHAGGFAGAVMNETELARLLGLDAVKMSREVFISVGPSTKATVLDTTLGTTGIVLFYNAMSGVSKDDPSNIKRFVSMTEGGTEYAVYRNEVNAKLVDITVEHYSNIVVTSTLGIRQITVS